jgi:MFS transporter, Spinster family, sphingosine-1-phosphate transporter
VTIISIATALQCAAVALCGLAGNFWQLLAVRIGVAVGEAGCVPPANSLIADYFTRAERPRAVARYMLGIPLSAVLGYFLAGWLNQIYGWRVTFAALGLPGVLLAAVAWLTLREPRREGLKPKVADGLAANAVGSEPASLSSDHPTLKEVCVTLWSTISFRHLLLCYSVASLVGYGVWQWKPAFFIRSYGLQTGELGTWFAVIYGFGGALGTYLGGELASRYAAQNERLQLDAMAVAYCSLAFISAGIYLSPSHYLAFGLMAITTFAYGMTIGPLFATIQTLVPDRMRAMAFALIYLFANLIGMGLGPLLAGALSDALRPVVGEESLRYALLALCPGYFWAAWHLWRASKAVVHDLQAGQVQRNDVARAEMWGA